MQKLSYTTLLIVEYQGAQTRRTDQQDSVNRKVHNADRGVQWIAECLAGQCSEVGGRECSRQAPMEENFVQGLVEDNVQGLVKENVHDPVEENA